MDAGLDNAATNNPFTNSNGEKLAPMDGFLQKIVEGGGYKANGADPFFVERTNGKRGAEAFEDEDMGPETDVDALDEVMEKMDVDQKHETEFMDKAPREETSTPTVDEVLEAGLVDNVAESGDDSEDEWNYYRPEKDNAQQTSQPDQEVAAITGSVEDVEEEEDGSMSQLNPDAAEFVPISPTRSIDSPAWRALKEESVISQSPRRVPNETITTDINLPNEKDFELEVKNRPSECYSNGHDNGQKISSQELMENLLNGKNIEDIEFQPNSTPVKTNEDFHFGPNATPFSTPSRILDQSETLSTKATFGDESTASYLDGKGFDSPFEKDVASFHFKKEADPMSMSFYAEKDEGNPFDLNKVQMLPDNLDEFLAKPDEDVVDQTSFNDTISDLPEHDPICKLEADLLGVCELPKSPAKTPEPTMNENLCDIPPESAVSPQLINKEELICETGGEAGDVCAFSPQPLNFTQEENLTDKPLEAASPQNVSKTPEPTSVDLLSIGSPEPLEEISAKSPELCEVVDVHEVAKSPDSLLEDEGIQSPDLLEESPVVCQSPELQLSSKPEPEISTSPEALIAASPEPTTCEKPSQEIMQENISPEPQVLKELECTNLPEDNVEQVESLRPEESFINKSPEPLQAPSSNPFNEYIEDIDNKAVDMECLKAKTASPELAEEGFNKSPVLLEGDIDEKRAESLVSSPEPLFENQISIAEVIEDLPKSPEPSEEVTIQPEPVEELAEKTKSPEPVEALPKSPEITEEIAKSPEPVDEIVKSSELVEEVVSEEKVQSPEPIDEIAQSPEPTEQMEISPENIEIMEKSPELSEEMVKITEPEEAVQAAVEPEPSLEGDSAVPVDSLIPEPTEPIAETTETPDVPNTKLSDLASEIQSAVSDVDDLICTKDPEMEVKAPHTDNIVTEENNVEIVSPATEIAENIESAMEEVKSQEEKPSLSEDICSPVEDDKLDEPLSDKLSPLEDITSSVKDDEVVLPAERCSLNYAQELSSAVQENITSEISSAIEDKYEDKEISEKEVLLELEAVKPRICVYPQEPRQINENEEVVQTTTDVTPLQSDASPVSETIPVVEAKTDVLGTPELIVTETSSEVKPVEQEPSKDESIVPEVAAVATAAAVGAAVVAEACKEEKKSATKAKAAPASKKPPVKTLSKSPAKPTTATKTTPRTPPSKAATSPTTPKPATPSATRTPLSKVATPRTPKASPAPAAKPSPRPRMTTTTTAKPTEKKPLTNGDVKKAPVPPIKKPTAAAPLAKAAAPKPLAAAKPAAAKPTPARPAPSTARPAPSAAKPATARTTTTTTKPRPTSLTTRTTTNPTTKTTPIAKSATSPSAAKSATAAPKPKPASTAAAPKARVPLQKPAAKAPDTEKQNKENVNKLMASRTSTTATKTTSGVTKTTTVRKTEVKGVASSRTTTTKSTTVKGSTLAAKKPTGEMKTKVTRVSKPIENGVATVTEITTTTTTTMNEMDPQLLKDLSPMENMIIDNSQLADTAIAD